jgi:hypothetical protein
MELIISFLITVIWDLLVSYEIVKSDYSAVFYKLIIMTMLYLFHSSRYTMLFSPDRTKYWKKVLKLYPFFGFVSIVYILLVKMVSVGMCTAYHNEALDGTVLWRRHYSTAFSRFMSPSTCPIGQVPCLVYTTLPEEALDGVFINFHVNQES